MCKRLKVAKMKHQICIYGLEKWTLDLVIRQFPFHQLVEEQKGENILPCQSSLFTEQVAQ